MNDKANIEFNEHSLSGQNRKVLDPPSCDTDKYLKYIEDFDISEEEKAELLKTIWFIMATFVDLGFGVDSTQLLSSSDQRQKMPDFKGIERDVVPINSKEVTHDDE